MNHLNSNNNNNNDKKITIRNIYKIHILCLVIRYYICNLLTKITAPYTPTDGAMLYIVEIIVLKLLTEKNISEGKRRVRRRGRKKNSKEMRDERKFVFSTYAVILLAIRSSLKTLRTNRIANICVLTELFVFKNASTIVIIRAVNITIKSKLLKK